MAYKHWGMADNGPAQQVQQARERLADGDTHILEYSRAIDPNTARNGPQKSLRTVETYTDNLRRFQDKAGAQLPEMDTEQVLAAFDDMRGDLAPDSVAQYQSAVKSFYKWSEVGDVDPDEIAVSSSSKTGIDEQSVLTGEDFHNLREHAGDSRARCIIDLLGYTGQRIRVIQTLRVKDVAPEDGATGSYWLNTDADGLKGAEKAMSKRPLLGAKKAVKEWLSYHPTGEPDDYLITPKAEASRGESGAMVAQNTIRRAIKAAAKKADIDKPVNPHAFRHFFATAAKRDYEMDDETIRRLLGHGAQSRIMETTYRHLSDDDVIADAEASYGVEPDEPEKESPLTPPVCNVCEAPLGPQDKACSSCGAVFAPNAKAAQDKVTDAAAEQKAEAETLEGHKFLDQLERAAREAGQKEVADTLGELSDE